MSKSIKLFLFLFLSVVSLKDLSSMPQRRRKPAPAPMAGVLPYCKGPNGQVWFLFGQDISARSNTWGDFGGEWVKDDGMVLEGCVYTANLADTAARCVHHATMGLFAGSNEENRINPARGISFFYDKILSDRKELMNCKTGYSLFFTEVGCKLLDSLKPLYSHFYNPEYASYVGFAWVNASDLLQGLMRRRNKIEVPVANGWLINADNYFQDFGNEEIVINGYLARELSSQAGYEFINRIIQENNQA